MTKITLKFCKFLHITPPPPPPHTHTHTQVEDTEHSTVRTCWETLTTFVKGLLESSKTIEPPNFSSDKPYVPADSITNYAYIFGELRKTTTKLS